MEPWRVSFLGKRCDMAGEYLVACKPSDSIGAIDWGVMAAVVKSMESLRWRDAEESGDALSQGTANDPIGSDRRRGVPAFLPLEGIADGCVYL